MPAADLFQHQKKNCYSPTDLSAHSESLISVSLEGFHPIWEQTGFLGPADGAPQAGRPLLRPAVVPCRSS